MTTPIWMITVICPLFINPEMETIICAKQFGKRE